MSDEIMPGGLLNKAWWNHGNARCTSLRARIRAGWRRPANRWSPTCWSRNDMCPIEHPERNYIAKDRAVT